MSWFDTTNIATFAKSALNTAQKTIDKALDIKEEHANKSDKKNKKSDADSFFDAFGLGDKPSTSQTLDVTQSKENATPLKKKEISSQNSGFWSDTWGSIFEIKGTITTKPDSENKNFVEDIPNTDLLTKDAVLFQPHGAGLFPNESQSPKLLHDVQNENVENTNVLNDSSLSVEYTDTALPTQITHSQQNEIFASESLKSNPMIVTEQPFSSIIPESEHLIFTPCSTIDSTNILSEVPDQGNYNVLPCDIESNEIFTPNSIVQKDIFLASSPIDPCNESMDQSEFFNIELPQKTESPIQVIEDSIVMESTSSSFTHLEMPEGKSFSANSMPIEGKINLDMIAVTESVGNWECSIIDSSSLYNLGESIIRQDSQMIDSGEVVISSPESSFHAIDTDSFNNNQLWDTTKEVSHSYDSQSFHNEEQHLPHRADVDSTNNKDDYINVTEEAKDCDTKSSSSSGSHTTSSSFVKCSVEENDSNSHRGQSPISTTASEKSDVTKHESEQNLSGDEIETATSSDIEILSPSNGENGDRNASPLKHVWLQRPLKFRRSESPTSDSSKESLMPVVSERDEFRESNASYQDKTLTPAEDETLEKLFQKQTELQNILEAREKKLLELSKENLELQENEERLKK